MQGSPAIPAHARAVPTLFNLVFSTGILSAGRYLGAGFGFLSALFLTAFLPPDALGRYFTVFSALSVAAIVVCLGYPSVTAKFLAEYAERGMFAERTRFLRTSRRRGLGLSIVAAGTGTIIGLFLLPESTGSIVAIGSWFLPAVALLRLNGAFAIARRRPALGFLPDAMARPLLFLCGLSVFPLLPAAMLPEATIILAVVAAWIAALYQGATLRPALMDVLDAGSQRANKADRASDRGWTATAIWMLPSVIALTLIAEAIVLAASPYLAADAIAVLTITLKLAFLGGFAIQAVLQALQPDIAEAIAGQDRANLFRINGLAGSVAMAAVIAATLAVWLLGEPLLALFGADYASGAVLLIWLTAAQAVRIPGLIATQILTQQGASRTLSACAALSLALLFGVSAILLPGADITMVAIPAIAAMAFFSMGTTWFAARSLRG